MSDKNTSGHTNGCTSDKQDLHTKDNIIYLKESDFYPPSDNRVWKSNVRDIYGGDNFADYCEYFYEVLDEEGYFES